MQRIAQRDRPYERMMDVEYIDILNQTYETHFGNSSEKNILALNTNNLDYVRSPDHLEYIDQRIRQAMKLTPFQESLPIEF